MKFEPRGEAFFSTRLNRRQVAQGAASATLAFTFGGSLSRAQTDPATPIPEMASKPSLGISPRPATRTASPATTIAFRGASQKQLGPVSVTGSSSGAASGVLVDHPDGMGVSFLPDSLFEVGETVTVVTAIPFHGNDLTTTFTIGHHIPHTELISERNTSNTETEPQAFVSRPDFRPAVLETPEISEQSTVQHVLLTPNITDGQSGPMIVDRNGELIWYHPFPVETWECLNLKPQIYKGQPVLTFWKGIKTLGYGYGHFVVMNARYEEIAIIRAGNGLQGLDPHDCTFTETGTALVAIYEPMAWDRSGTGGSAEGRTLASVIQEIDIETGLVLSEWNSLDHVDLEESVSERGADENAFFDYFHINSINLDTDHNVLVSARNTSTIYKIDPLRGDIIWRLGGKNSDFEMGEGATFNLQHDAQRQADGTISLFDNASGEQDDDETVDSRGLILNLNMESMEAMVALELVDPTGLLAVTQGNLQALPDGTFFVGWGNHPSYSQFSADGEVLYNCRIAQQIQSYRAYTCPWVGLPGTKPDVVVTGQEGQRIAWISWNGATEVAKWRLWAPSSRTSMEQVVIANRTGFETQVRLPESVSSVKVEALDKFGVVLGASDLAGA